MSTRASTSTSSNFIYIRIYMYINICMYTYIMHDTASFELKHREQGKSRGIVLSMIPSHHVLQLRVWVDFAVSALSGSWVFYVG